MSCLSIARMGIIDFLSWFSFPSSATYPIHLSFDCPPLAAFQIYLLVSERSVIASHRASRSLELHIRHSVHISSSSKPEIDQIARHMSG